MKMKATLNPQVVCHTIRELRKAQCKTAFMNSDVTRFIKEEGLVQEVLWPCHHIRITEAGLQYLAEHEQE
jgi:hypothetical protein